MISILTAENPARVNEIRQLIQDAQAGRIRVVVSQLARAEIVPFDSNDPQHVQLIDDFFLAARSVVRFVDVTRSIAEDARQLVANHRGDKLTVPDAVHLATAIQLGARVFFTYDGARDKLRNRSGGLLGLDGRVGQPPLRISVPTVDLGPLFARRQAPS